MPTVGLTQPPENFPSNAPSSRCVSTVSPERILPSAQVCGACSWCVVVEKCNSEIRLCKTVFLKYDLQGLRSIVSLHW